MTSLPGRSAAVPMDGQSMDFNRRGQDRVRSCGEELQSSDVATQVAQHGSGMPVPDWARLL
jgi:hypothetical protein